MLSSWLLKFAILLQLLPKLPLPFSKELFRPLPLSSLCSWTSVSITSPPILKEGTVSTSFQLKLISISPSRSSRRRRRFCQTLSHFANPLDLCDQHFLLDMNFLGTPQLRAGVNVSFFFKVSFLKHPNVHTYCEGRYDSISDVPES